MFNPGLYFLTLDLFKTKVLLNLGLENFVIPACMSTYNSLINTHTLHVLGKVLSFKGN